MRRLAPGSVVLGLCLAAGTAAAQPGAAPVAPPPGTAAETPAPVATASASPAPSASASAPDAPGAQPLPPAPAAAAEPSPAAEAPAAAAEPAAGAATLDETATTEPPATDPDAPERPPAPPVPPAEDLVSRHVNASALALLAVPFGSLERELPWYDVAATGPGAGLEIAVGVSRNVSIGAWGDLVLFGSGPECTDCSTLTFSGGPLVRFHLVQGMRFDPHVTAGVGLRSTTTRSSPANLDYLGLDWLRLTAGGDWYATPNLALSPFFTLAAGATVRLPDESPVRLAPGEERQSGVYGTALFGLRLTLDAPGR